MADKENMRLKFKLKNQISPERLAILKEANEVSFLPMESIGEQGELDLSQIKPREEVSSGYTLLFDGDVVVAKITPCFENGKGALIQGLKNGAGFGTTELYVLTPGPELDGKFLFYITQSASFRIQGEGEMTGSAGQKRVPETFIRNFRLSFPPLIEQQRIVAYLDGETTHLDELREEKENFLELLELKRAALIVQAITRGLDTTPLKSSGVEWIGKVPQTWDVLPLFAVMRELQERNIGNAEKNVLSLSYGKIVRRDVESNFGLLPESFETYQIVEAGNIVLRLTDLQNDKKSLRVGLAKERGIITSAYFRLEVGSRMLPEFAYYLLHAYDLLKVFYDLGAGVRQSMKFEDMKRLPILVPPLPEQQVIVSYLERMLSEMDELKTALIESLDLLAQRRAALIAAAVTRRIKIAA